MRLRPPAGLTLAPVPHPVGNWKVVTARLLGGAVILWGVLLGLGELLTHVLDKGAFHRADLGVDTWLEAHRTLLWDHITHVGTDLATTMTAIIVGVAVALFLRWHTGRWYESLVVVTIMAGELTMFLTLTQVVERPRPPVIRLDVAPPTTSFPSGHTAASTALYGGLAVLILRTYAPRLLPRLIAGLLFFLPVFVGFSRLYRGMHYPTDVLGGALLSTTWLIIVFSTLMPRRPASPRLGTGPPDADTAAPSPAAFP
jgi:membrane-associated phospholipid phosphatase